MGKILLYLMFLVPLLPIGLSIALRQARKREAGDVTPGDVTPGNERLASLTEPSSSAALWWSAILLPLAPLAGVAWLLAARYTTLPTRFSIHWGLSGRPDGWADRSFGSVFGLLLLGSMLLLMLGGLGELIARSSLGHAGRADTIAFTRRVLLASAWFLALVFCVIGVLPLAQDPTSLVPLLSWSTVVFSLGITVYVAFRALRAKSALRAAGNSTDVRFWKAGLFYFNPADSARMVPKRSGLGYTFNFGHPLSWLALAAILLLPLLLPLLLHGHGPK